MISSSITLPSFSVPSTWAISTPSSLANFLAFGLADGTSWDEDLTCLIEVSSISGFITLIFYGLGLINASKYTYGEIEVLGYVQLILGLIASFFMGSGLLFWVIGFGFCHIVFGIIFYLRHDAK